MEKNIKMWWGSIFIFWSALVSLPDVRAELSRERPIHHQFNARLLNPEESQISILGNFKYGLSPTLEVGTQVFGLLQNALNLSLKHNMLTIGNVQTSFTTHVFYLTGDGNFLQQMLDTDALTTGFFAPIGITSTVDINPHLAANAGFFDYYLNFSSKDLMVEMHIFSALLGVDWIIDSQWGITVLTLQPVYRKQNLNSDVIEVTNNGWLLSASERAGIQPHAFYFLGMTRSWETFNLELGLYSSPLKKVTAPYINAFWRVK